MGTYQLKVSNKADSIIQTWIKEDTIAGDIENWSHNIEKDYLGQAARNMQALIVKLAKTVEKALITPKADASLVQLYDKKKKIYFKSEPNLSFVEGAIKYMVNVLLNERDLKPYYVLCDFFGDSKRSCLNNEANFSKHSLRESRFCAKESSKVYNELVRKIANKIKIKSLLKFSVDASCVKNIDEPTTNYFYLKPIKGEADYEIKKKREDEVLARFRKTLITPEDYYIQLKAIKYQRDMILKEEMDNKWDQIRKDHKDHSKEMMYITEAIGGHTNKINILINNLIYNNINSPKTIKIALRYIEEEVERNNKIIDYTKWEINGVKAGKWNLISSTGIVTTNYESLERYIDHKEEQNDRLLQKRKEIKDTFGV